MIACMQLYWIQQYQTIHMLYNLLDINLSMNIAAKLLLKSYNITVQKTYCAILAGIVDK